MAFLYLYKVVSIHLQLCVCVCVVSYQIVLRLRSGCQKDLAGLYFSISVLSKELSLPRFTTPPPPPPPHPCPHLPPATSVSGLRPHCGADCGRAWSIANTDTTTGRGRWEQQDCAALRPVGGGGGGGESQEEAGSSKDMTSSGRNVLIG